MTTTEPCIEINIREQRLCLLSGDHVLHKYKISTAKNGPGEITNSECTPRGKHVIADKIGDGCIPGMVFVGREPTGEIYHPKLREEGPDRDWILTRILWLKGTEPGKNQGGNVDSYQRYIYIHGSPDDVEIGKPGSRGCIRMNNEDVIALFDQVRVGTSVIISDCCSE